MKLAGCVLSLLLFTCGSASASFVFNSVGPVNNVSDGTDLTGTQNVAKLYDQSVSGNEISVYVDVYALHKGFTLQFSGSASAIGNVGTIHLYVTNNLGSYDNGVVPAIPGPVDPGNTGKEIGPLSITRSAGTVNFVHTTASQSSNPNHYAINDKPTTDTSILFGGAKGGGGSIAYGTGTDTSGTNWNEFTFQVAATQTGTKTFNLTFTANPEPGSLALAGLLGIPGLLGLRRRRGKAVEAEVIAV